MAFRKIIAKLNDYYGRLDKGKTRKIKTSHVKKVIAKLAAKKKQIAEELAQTDKDSKKDRLARKLLIADEHLKRAEWLAEKIQSAETETNPSD